MSRGAVETVEKEPDVGDEDITAQNRSKPTKMQYQS